MYPCQQLSSRRGAGGMLWSLRPHQLFPLVRSSGRSWEPELGCHSSSKALEYALNAQLRVALELRSSSEWEWLGGTLGRVWGTGHRGSRHAAGRGTPLLLGPGVLAHHVLRQRLRYRRWNAGESFAGGARGVQSIPCLVINYKVG